MLSTRSAELNSLLSTLENIQKTCDERAAQKQIKKPIIDYIEYVLYSHDYEREDVYDFESEKNQSIRIYPPEVQRSISAIFTETLREMKRCEFIYGIEDNFVNILEQYYVKYHINKRDAVEKKQEAILPEEKSVESKEAEYESDAKSSIQASTPIKSVKLPYASLVSDKDEKKETEAVEAPIDVMNIILDYENSYGIIGHGNVPLVPTLFNAIKPRKLKEKLENVRALLTAVVNGKPDEVKAMLEKDSSLLLDRLEEKDDVTALSGQRSNNVTAYRTALAIEDTQMAAMIKAKLIEVSGEDVANAQYREQFPEGWEADEEKRWAPLFTQLNTLTDVIIEAKQDDITSSGHPEYKLTVREGSAVATALAQFRSLLDAKLNDIVTTGRHFNPKLLLQAFKIYDDRYEDFGNNWSDPRAMLLATSHWNNSACTSGQLRTSIM